MNDWKSKIVSFWRKEDGIGTLEIIMIVAVIVVIAIAFRKWIMQWIKGLFAKTDQSITEFGNFKSDDISPAPTP